LRPRGAVDPLWSASPGLVWTHFDDSDEWVVFNPFSGDIHLLSASAHALWQLTTSGPPRSSAELIDTLAADLEHLADEEFAAAARETLAFMDRAGLVTPAHG
jgi:PqqD family protein of HPr-rel-A system